jgi:hypothetical protein
MIGFSWSAETVVMGGVEIFNALEAVWWFALAALAAAIGGRARGMTPRRQGALTTFLALFGVSDAIEVFTGAWWNPPALLVLKALCLGGLIGTAWLIYRERWRRAETATPPD